MKRRLRPRFLLLRFWSFSSAIDLLRAARALGIDGKVTVKSLSGANLPPTRSHTSDLVNGARNYCAVEFASSELAGVQAKVRADIQVSPLDPIFPEIDWSAALSRDDQRLRLEAASLILGVTLRGISSYPSVLTIHALPRAGVPEAHFARAVVEAIIARFSDSNLGHMGVGYLSSGSGVQIPLPPETMAKRLLQIDVLRHAFDRMYPIMFLDAEPTRFEHVVGNTWAMVGSRTATVIFRTDDWVIRLLDDDPVAGLQAVLLSDDDYVDLQRRSGLVEMRGVAVLIADRSQHPLAREAIGAMTALGGELVGRSGTQPLAGPALLVAGEQAVLIRAALDRGLSFPVAVRSPGVLLPEEALEVVDRWFS